MEDFLTKLGIEENNLGGFCGEWIGTGPQLEVTSPVDGAVIAQVRQVTEEEGLTVQVTPLGPGADLWIESQGLDEIVVRGKKDVEFHYFVNGVRVGFADVRIVAPNQAFVPTTAGVPPIRASSSTSCAPASS